MKSNTLLFLMLLCLPTSVALADVTPRSVESGVEGVDSAGEVVWKIEHRSAFLSGEVVHPVVGPVQHDGNWYYAIRGDLMRLDVAEGVIRERTQYPTLIESLESGEKGLKVGLSSREWSDETDFAVVHESDRYMGRGAWGEFPSVALRPEADVDFPSLDSMKDRDWADVRKRLRSQERSDPLNALVPAYRGFAAQLDGDDEAAAKAFDAALGVKSTWGEDLILCGILERAKRPSLASVACERAREKLDAEGVRRDALVSLVMFVVTMRSLNFAMEEAIATGDVESADRIAGRMYETYPNVEAGYVGWRLLASWLREQGAIDAARRWQEAADVAARDEMSRAFWGQAREVDLGILLVVVAPLVVAMSGFMIGLRRREDDESSDGWRGFLPRPNVVEIVLVVLIAILGLLATFGAMRSVVGIGAHAEAPIAVMQEAYGAPEVIEWLDMSLAPSEPRDELLEYGRAELDAIKSGEPLERDPPDRMALVNAVEAHSTIVARQEMFQLSWPWEMRVDAVDSARMPNVLPLGFPALAAFLVFGLVGVRIRRASDSMARMFQWFVPGAGTSFGPIILFFAVGSFAFIATPLGGIFQSIAIPSMGRYFGLGAVDDSHVPASIYGSDQPIAWALLIGTLAIHLVTMLIRRRRDARAS